ncbi:MAG: DUF6794 domain-containing protein [Bacteroidota bacterium]
MPKIVLLGCWLMIFQISSAQTIPNNDKEFEEQYEKRIRKEYLFYPPVYIPRDLTDAFVNLNKLLEADARQKFRLMSEKDVEYKIFFSFGRWIIRNWGFYGGSRLSHFLKGLGLHHPEDMALFVMLTYHRNLNKKKLDVKDLLTYILDKRDKRNKERLLKGKVIHESTRQRSKQ